MADIVEVKNISAYLNPVAAYASTALSASGGGSGSTGTGITIDRLATQGLYRSVDVVAIVRSSGSSKYKHKLFFRLQDSANGSSWTAFGSASGSTLSFGSTSATGKQKIKKAGSVGVDINAARRYIRVNPVLSWFGTNKSTPATVSVVAVLGGADINT